VLSFPDCHILRLPLKQTGSSSAGTLEVELELGESWVREWIDIY
jgi:hypothetical protein